MQIDFVNEFYSKIFVSNSINSVLYAVLFHPSHTIPRTIITILRKFDINISSSVTTRHNECNFTMLSLLRQFLHTLRNTRNRITWRVICLWEFLRSNIQRIKRVHPIRAVLQQILFRLCQLPSRLILRNPLVHKQHKLPE
jgi:hypothetical protein